MHDFLLGSSTPDPAQSNCLSGHNIDPNIIASAAFGQISHFTTFLSFFGLPEQFQASSLVYTPPSAGRQIVLAFSLQNKIYALDAIYRLTARCHLK
jgi:iron transport multicopper oxidase